MSLENWFRAGDFQAGKKLRGVRSRDSLLVEQGSS
jgi:hypothetical protein